MKDARQRRRPDWLRTHHTKPARPSGRRERQQLRQLRGIAQVAR